jgi:NTP pyrophosphatase (non-canonical NTP hydrolase)
MTVTMHRTLRAAARFNPAMNSIRVLCDLLARIGGNCRVADDQHETPRRRPAMPARNPLVDFMAIGEHAEAVMHLDLRDGAECMTLGFGRDSQPMLAALLNCAEAKQWAVEFGQQIGPPCLPTQTAPADSPLRTVEQLRGRALRFRERLDESPRKPLIEQHLNAIEDCCDSIHFALGRQPEAERWRAELIAYERAEHQREQPAAAPATDRGGAAHLSFADLRQANCERQKEWDADNRISLIYRATELAEEAGEVCGVIKKLARETLDLVGTRSSHECLSEELADTVIVADLIAMQAGIDLAAAITNKFDKTSQRFGFVTKIKV